MTETAETPQPTLSKARFGENVRIKDIDSGREGTVIRTEFNEAGDQFVIVHTDSGEDRSWRVGDHLQVVPRAGTVAWLGELFQPDNDAGPDEQYFAVVVSDNPDRDGDFVALRVQGLNTPSQKIHGYVYLSPGRTQVQQIEQLTEDEFRIFMIRAAISTASLHDDLRSERTRREYLEREVEHAQARLDSIVEAAHEYADDKNLCSEFDEFMERQGLPGRVREFTLRVTVELDLSVEARSSEEAENMAEDELDSGLLAGAYFSILEAEATEA